MQGYVPACVALAKHIINHIPNYKISQDRPAEIMGFDYNEQGNLAQHLYAQWKQELRHL